MNREIGEQGQDQQYKIRLRESSEAIELILPEVCVAWLPPDEELDAVDPITAANIAIFESICTNWRCLSINAERIRFIDKSSIRALHILLRSRTERCIQQVTPCIVTTESWRTLRSIAFFPLFKFLEISVTDQNLTPSGDRSSTNVS